MHKEVKLFCQSVKLLYPMHFSGVDVLDCGSLDINGNNRYLFDKSNYLGIDIVRGNNVDIVTRVHEFKPSNKFDCIISTEMLEHDEYFAASLNAMFKLLKPGGLLLITAAGHGRKEHGTHNFTPQDSPLTQSYYRNIDVTMLLQGLELTNFYEYTISYRRTDIRFAGIKNIIDENKNH